MFPFLYYFFGPLYLLCENGSVHSFLFVQNLGFWKIEHVDFSWLNDTSNAFFDWLIYSRLLQIVVCIYFWFKIGTWYSFLTLIMLDLDSSYLFDFLQWLALWFAWTRMIIKPMMLKGFIGFNSLNFWSYEFVWYFFCRSILLECMWFILTGSISYILCLIIMALILTCSIQFFYLGHHGFDFGLFDFFLVITALILAWHNYWLCLRKKLLPRFL